MYGAALPAGSFRGSLGRYHQRPSHQGAAVRGMMKMRALGRTGMSGLGEGTDFCTDPGWQVANQLISAAGSTITSINASSAGEGQTADAGWAAAGGSITSLATAWQQTCSQQAAQAQQAANAELERQRLENQLAIERARAQNSLSTTAAPGTIAGIDTNVVLIGAAVVGLGIMALALRK